MAKKPRLFIDGRTPVNGKKNSILKYENPIAVHDYIERLLPFILPTSGTNPPLVDVLTIGNTTGGNDIIMTSGDTINSSSGDSFIDLRFFGFDDRIIISNDAVFPHLSKGFISLNPVSTTVGLGSNRTQATLTTITMTAQAPSGNSYVSINENIITIGDADLDSTTGIVLVDNSVDRASAGNGNAATSINSSSTTKAGTIQAVIVGGVGMTAKTNFAAYVNKISLQKSGVLFDSIIIHHPTVTADRVATLPNTSGTILVQEVTEPFNSGTLVDGECAMATGGIAGITLTLPVPKLNNRIVIKKVDAFAGKVTVSGGGNNIDGLASIDLGAQYNTITVVSNDLEWWIVAKNF